MGSSETAETVSRIENSAKMRKKKLVL